MPVLTTERLLLRIAHRREARMVADYFARNREHHRRAGFSRTASYYTEDYWKDTIPKERADAHEGTCFRFRIFRRGDETRVIGVLSLRSVERMANHSCAIGYSLDNEETGKGYMREAVTLAVSFAFDKLNLMRIEATYVPDNVRSGRLLADLGFEVEGMLRNMMIVDGEFADHVICSRINPNWRAPLDSAEKK